MKPLRLSCLMGFWGVVYQLSLSHLSGSVGASAVQHQQTAYLDLIHNIEGILISSIGEDDLDQSVRKPVWRGFAFKGIPEIGLRIDDFRMAAEDDETGDSNEDERQDLDNSDSIREPV